MDVALPVILVPSAILIGTLHPALTILMLVFMPLSLITSYRLWLAMKKKPRTRIFFTYGLVSYIQMYLTFEFVVCNMWEVRLWENLLCTTLFATVVYALYCIKKDPGIVKSRSGNTAPHDMMENFTQLHEQQGQNASNSKREQNNVSSQSANGIRQESALHEKAGDQNQTDKGVEDDKLATETSVTIEDENKKKEEEDLMNFGPIGMALINNMGFDKK